jgi:uncharacterized membrane protein YoaK (UPF0700 family)
VAPEKRQDGFYTSSLRCSGRALAAGLDPRQCKEAAVTRNSRQILVMSIASIIGGIIGFIVGQFVLSPAVLIPIGVVIGIAVSLPMVQKRG